MTNLALAVLAASTVRNIGIVISVIVGIGFIAYGVINIRSGRREIGSEIELAPNRKPYYDDEQLEGPRLDRALATGIVMLGVVALALPLYWLNEPGRQTDAVATFDETRIDRGARLFATTEDGGYNCAGCHGAEGVGGQAAYTISEEDGSFVATANWRAPALNTVLSRFSKEELTYVLVYGRPFSPMPAWGAEGGGPLTTQQIEDLVRYIESIQLTSDEARGEVEKALRDELGLGQDEEIDYQDPEVGEALFNLGEDSGTAAGAYSCARCHTRGWSIIPPIEPADAPVEPFTDFPDGEGALGPNLRNPLVPRQFGTWAEMLDFVIAGSVEGEQYGRNGQGSGKMPGFGDNPNTEEADDDGMMSDDMVAAIVCYEATFEAEDAGEDTETVHDECWDQIEKAREDAAAAEAEAEAEESGDSAASEEEG